MLNRHILDVQDDEYLKSNKINAIILTLSRLMIVLARRQKQGDEAV
jgi:hypothetical protein